MTSSTNDEKYICKCKEYQKSALENSTPLLEFKSNLNNKAFSNTINRLSEDTTFIKENSKFDSLSAFFISNISANNEYLNSPIIGYAKMNDKAIVSHIFKRFVEEKKIDNMTNIDFMWSQKPKNLTNDGDNYFSLYALNNKGSYQITHENIDFARLSKHPNDKFYGVSISFDEEGAVAFSELTKENINNCISTISYSKVLSAPFIFNQVVGGSVFIDGNFTKLEAEKLIKRLNCYNYSQRIGQRKFDRKLNRCN